MLGRGFSDSDLVVLMSGHFSAQILCHLTSQLLYKKGHSTHSHESTQYVLGTQPLPLHLHFQPTTHTLCTTKKCYLTKFAGIHHWFHAQKAHPCCHISHCPSQAADFLGVTVWDMCCTERSTDLSPTVSEVLHIVVIHLDTARQAQNYQLLSGAFWEIKCFDGGKKGCWNIVLNNHPKKFFF